MASPMEQVFSKTVRKDNLNMWGKLFIDKTGHGKNGWLVDSWSDSGAPYWRPKFNWIRTEDRKIYLFQADIGIRSIGTEDTEIEPERADFIRETIAQWELDWLRQAK